jgi:hypothetical protein
MLANCIFYAARNDDRRQTIRLQARRAKVSIVLPSVRRRRARLPPLPRCPERPFLFSLSSPLYRSLARRGSTPEAACARGSMPSAWATDRRGVSVGRVLAVDALDPLLFSQVWRAERLADGRATGCRATWAKRRGRAGPRGRTQPGTSSPWSVRLLLGYQPTTG